MYTKLSDFKWNGKNVQLFQTNEWSRFKRAKGNREPEPIHVRKLAESIGENELFTSIVVNENWEVIDGQHRRQAFENVGIPVLVHVVPGLTADDIKTYNVNMHNWKDDNYLNYYIELGNKHYLVFKQFQDDTGWGHGTARSLLSGHAAGSNSSHDSKAQLTNSKHVFIKGDFVVDRQALIEAYELASLIKKIDFRHKRNQSFITAFQSMIRWFKEENVKYNHERMIHAFALYGRDYEQRPKRAFEFKLDLQKLYNHNRSVKNKVLFLSAEELVEGIAA